MIEGACHCGAVRWKFDVTPKSATACNCTICRRYGVLWAYDLAGDRTQFSGPRALTSGPPVRGANPESVFTFAPSAAA